MPAIRITLSSTLKNLRTTDAIGFQVTATFFDDSTDPWIMCVPDTVSYRIDRVLKGIPQVVERLKDWTAISPASRVQLEIIAADNDIPDDHSADEFRRITIIAKAGDIDGSAVLNYCIVPRP